MKCLRIGLILGLLAVAVAAIAHIPENTNSVHFISGEPNFESVPRRADLHWRSEQRMSSEDSVFFAERETGEMRKPYWDESDAHAVNRQRWITQMFALCRKARWKPARHTVRYFGSRYRWTGELRDLDLVLERVQRQPAAQRTALKPAIAVFFNAVRQALKGERDTAYKSFLALSALPNTGFLREHAAYQIATAEPNPAAQRTACRAFLRDFPKSPKREDALIMIARNDILPELPKDRDITGGKAAMAQLKREYPHSRFLKELPGLRTRLLYLDKQYTLAAETYLQRDNLYSVQIVLAKLLPPEKYRYRARLLRAYLRRIVQTKDFELWSDALRQVHRLREQTSVEQARITGQMLRNDPEFAANYLYYRLYHALYHKSDLPQLAHLAEEVARRHPRMKFSTGVMTRFAEAAYRNRDYKRATLWTEYSLQHKTTDRALFVRGLIRQKFRQTRAATRDFETILRRFPQSPLVTTANENLALLYEAAGRFDLALDCFFRLSKRVSNRYSWGYEYETSWAYQPDIAYLIDCRMTTAQVSDYTRSRLRHPHHDLLVYSLGIRYLREERWNEAERQFRRLPLAIYDTFSKGRKEWGEKPSPAPLSVVRDLRKLHRNIALARNGNSRAKAMYDYASYYSTHGTLLLYNSALWNNERMYSFDWWWNPIIATKQDELAVRRYMYQHEPYARSRAICQKIAQRYPNAPSLPHVLYRQAAATRRLCGFNHWWNKETDRSKMWDESIRTMRRIARTYPRHPVAVHARKYASVFENEHRELVWERQNRNTLRTNAQSRYAAVTKTQ